MDRRDRNIGPTAHYTAYVWHRLGLPYADLFHTPRGAALFWGFRGAGEWVAAVLPRLPSMVQYLELRHRLIDLELERIGPDRVVELGAGLSRRGVTLAADRGIRVTEVDLPHMVAAKQARLAKAPKALRRALEGRFEVVSRDLTDHDFADWLSSELSGAARPVVISEGVLGYFAPSDRSALARAIARALGNAGGGSFLCDLRSGEGGRAVAAAATVVRAGIRVATRGRGARADFESLDAVSDFFSEAGFSSATALSPAALPHLSRLRSPSRVWRADLQPSQGPISRSSSKS